MYRALIIGVALSCVPAIGEAQVRDRPARPTRSLFGGGQAPHPNRVGQEVTLSTSLLGAYDNILAPPLTAADDQPEQVRQTGRSGVFDTTLRYFVGRESRSVEVTGRGFATVYGGGSPLVGGDARAGGTFRLRRRNHVSLGLSAQNAPYSSLGEFGSLAGAFQPSMLPDGDASLVLAEQRSWMYGSFASFRRQLNNRQSLGLSYDFNRTDYQGQSGFDSRSHSIASDYSWQVRRSAALTANYRVGRTQFLGDVANSQRSQTFDSGFDYSRRLSSTRNLGLSAAFGASYTEEEERLTGEQPGRRGHWSPSGRAGFRVDLARSWALNAGYSRLGTVFNRISPRLFYTDAFLISAGGMIGARLDTVASAGFSTGDTSVSDGAVGAFESYTATYQLRWAISRCCATVASYNYYSYRLEGLSLPSGLPQHSGSSGLRIGMSIWLPLFGAATVPTGGSGF